MLLGPLAALGAVGIVADAIWPSLIEDHPLVVVAMNPRIRFLVLAAPSVAWGPFLAVALVRSLVGDPFAYLLGRRYGDTAVDQLVRRSGRFDRLTRRLVDWTRRAGPAAVVIAPGSIVCAMVGASGLRLRTFLVCNVGGTVARVLAVRALGSAFSDPLTAIVEWIGDHRLVLTALMILVVLGGRWWSGRAAEGELVVAQAAGDLGGRDSRSSALPDD